MSDGIGYLVYGVDVSDVYGYGGELGPDKLKRFEKDDSVSVIRYNCGDDVFLALSGSVHRSWNNDFCIIDPKTLLDIENSADAKKFEIWCKEHGIDTKPRWILY